MGREIRRVPPNWQHPMEANRHTGRQEYRPMYDENFAYAALAWRQECEEFYSSGKNIEEECEFWEWHGGPPDRETYREYFDADATWFQLYETVSEGTPVSPPFETKQELADYLASNGDFWDQIRRADGFSTIPCMPWGKERAERFVFGGGWAPSMVVENGVVMSGVEAMTKDPS